MAKGKYGNRATNRANAAALAHIDRLTEQLAEEKMRRRAAETRAAQYAGLDNLARVSEARHDEALRTALDKVQSWYLIAEEDRDRRRAAMRELRDHFHADIRFMGTNVEWMEFLVRRYPRLLSALTAGELRSARRYRDHRSPFRRIERKLTEDELVKFQVVTGQRGLVRDGPHAGKVVDWSELFEARQVAGFDLEEMLELSTEHPGGSS